MIATISQQDAATQLVAQYLKTIKNQGFTGDTDASYATRLTVSTDNSIYQQMPQGVIFPRSEKDIQIALETAGQDPFLSLTFGPRGGGTGTNGQSLTPGIVVDLSRYMREILEINEAEGWVRVQAGVIKDQLNDFLKPFGYFFSPDLSTSNRATIGGMVNT
ncbi:FAD-binding oxidoreductase, partial [Pseudoalteromonas sp.]